MWRLRRKSSDGAGGAAVLEPRPDLYQDIDGSQEDLRAEIESLSQANREARDLETERRLLRLRHVAGLQLVDTAPEHPQFAAPDPDGPAPGSPLPELRPQDLTPGLLRAGILRDGCVLVRGLVTRARALRFAEQIDRGFAERDRYHAREDAAAEYYDEFEPHARFGPLKGRHWIMQGGGLLAADAPMLNFELMEIFRAAGLRTLVSGYLGEPALISAHKTTLRKADPSIAGAWHQDGYFMGREVRSLNLWLSLSRCGDEAPGLDIVPRRLEHYVATNTDDAMLDYTISQRKAEETAAGAGTAVIRPIFEPGDALFFDELFLHQTGSDPSMPKPRYAVENWFFGGSGFPGDYAALAV